MEEIAEIIALALHNPSQASQLASRVTSLARKFRIPTHY